MMIAVYGASGYTGRLVLAELARRKIPAVPVGRNADRLLEAVVSAGLAGPEPIVAGLDDPGLPRAFDGCDAVINCAGPFAGTGERVAAAAIAAGSHYTDISGEQLYLRRIFERFGGEAAVAGVAVVPGANDDALPASLIAHLAAGAAGPVEDLVIALDLAGGGDPPSRGTLRSALASAGTFRDGGLSYDNGTWRTGAALRRKEITFPGESEPAAVVRFPLPGLVFIPRHVWAAHAEAVARASLSAALSGVSEEMIGAVPEGPSEASRNASRWTIVAEATSAGGRRTRGVVTGRDQYGTTAVIAVEAARRLVVGSGEARGVLAPAQVFDSGGFLDFLTRHHVTWSVERNDR